MLLEIPPEDQEMIKEFSMAVKRARIVDVISPLDRIAEEIIAASECTA